MAQRNGAGRLDVVPDPLAESLQIEGLDGELPGHIQSMVGGDGTIRTEDPEEALALLKQACIPSLRISQDIVPWLDARRRAQDRKLSLQEVAKAKAR